MMSPHEGGREARLNALFQAYLQACPDPEPSANFMPQLWQRIEARQRYSFFFGRIARGFVTAAVAVTLAMALYLSVPRSTSVFYSGSYIDVLAASHPADTSETYDTTHYDVGTLPDEL